MGVAVLLLVRAIGGHREETVVISGYGTAAWFAIIGGGLLAAGLGLLRGQRWGRGLVVIVELLLLFVAWYVGVGSQQYLAGIVLALVCGAALAALFRRDAIEWYAVRTIDRDGRDALSESAAPGASGDELVGVDGARPTFVEDVADLRESGDALALLGRGRGRGRRQSQAFLPGVVLQEREPVGNRDHHPFTR